MTVSNQTSQVAAAAPRDSQKTKAHVHAFTTNVMKVNTLTNINAGVIAALLVSGARRIQAIVPVHVPRGRRTTRRPGLANVQILAVLRDSIGMQSHVAATAAMV